MHILVVERDSVGPGGRCIERINIEVKGDPCEQFFKYKKENEFSSVNTGRKITLLNVIPYDPVGGY